MSKNSPTRCSECGGTTGQFTTYINASTAETHYVCTRCASEQSAARITDIAEIDSLIEEMEEHLLELEPMLKHSPDHNSLPVGLRELVQTPLTSYLAIQEYIAVLKTRRVELLTQSPSPEKIKYELDKLISEENYEQAAKVQKELDDLLKGGKTKKKKAQKSKLLGRRSDKSVGKCINCKSNYPKPANLFSKLEEEDPKIQFMCLPCISERTLTLVRTVETADYMIKELEEYSKVADGLSMFTAMFNMDEEDLEGIESLDDIPRVETPAQEFNRIFLERLKFRRNHLAKNGEDDPVTLGYYEHFQAQFDKLKPEERQLMKALLQHVIGKMMDEMDEEDESPSATKPQLSDKGKRGKKKG